MPVLASSHVRVLVNNSSFFLPVLTLTHLWTNTGSLSVLVSSLEGPMACIVAAF